jgi:hypothetical protein
MRLAFPFLTTVQVSLRLVHGKNTACHPIVPRRKTAKLLAGLRLPWLILILMKEISGLAGQCPLGGLRRIKKQS